MGVQYRCGSERRRAALRAHPELNGIDYLEVLDLSTPQGSPEDSPRQCTLLVRLFRPVSAYSPGVGADNVRIDGGVRIRAIGVEWAYPATDIPPELVTPEEDTFFLGLAEPDHVLVVRTDASGDYSTYRFSLVTSPTEPRPPAGFDVVLSDVDFSFKAECPSVFDCETERTCPAERFPAPAISYLAKDYAGFRQLMLDRLAVVMPEWRDRNVADLGIALVELLAYAGDYLSYYQDAVATEAYLGTARRRISVRRHARLLDYRMHDGCNARAWVTFEIAEQAPTAILPAGTRLLTRTDEPAVVLDPSEDELDLLRGKYPDMLEFETLHDLALRPGLAEIRFYTWGDEDCCLPRGATRATLRNERGALDGLAVGDVLVFEEVRGPNTGRPEDADPNHRHAVRLSAATFVEDPLYGDDDSPASAVQVVDVEWQPEDALPFPLCLREVVIEDSPMARGPVSVARGNVVLADHGRTIEAEPLDPDTVPENEAYRPRLGRGDVTQRVRYDHDRAIAEPAASAMRHEPGSALPAVRLTDRAEPEEVWLPQRDLLASDRFAREFVVEIENEGTARLRFGDGVHGRRPDEGARLEATYRIGLGTDGNVGAEAIAHVVTGIPAILKVRNPLPAVGGVEPEALDTVRLMAPQAFRIQQRAVTAEDYAAKAELHPEVAKAVATRRWTGSWHTIFVTVDRRGGLPVDEVFERELRDWLERFRLACHDVEIDPPRFVPLDIAMTVCVGPGYFRADVKEALLDVFGHRVRRDGSLGFFHPDNLTFGQPVYLSEVIATAMEVPGVRWVDFDDTEPKPNRFRRWGELSRGELDDGLIKLDRLEIARLDNDPSARENGRIEFFLEGGQ